MALDRVEWTGTPIAGSGYPNDQGDSPWHSPVTTTRFRNSAPWRSPARGAAPMSAAWLPPPMVGCAMRCSARRNAATTTRSAARRSAAHPAACRRDSISAASPSRVRRPGTASHRGCASEEAPADDGSEGSVEDADAGRERLLRPGPGRHGRTRRQRKDGAPRSGRAAERERYRVAGRSVSEVVTGPLEDDEIRELTPAPVCPDHPVVEAAPSTMPFEKTYATHAPERTELEALEEPALIEFGTAVVRLVPRGPAAESPPRSLSKSASPPHQGRGRQRPRSGEPSA